MAIQTREITVVGAGVIGIACARWLQRDGHRVRVLDLRPPGHGCSWGNAGVFATDAIIPLATPATLAAVPGMLARPDAALSLRWGYLPRLLPWLPRFVANARPARVRAITRVLTSLCTAAQEATGVLVHGSPAADLVHASGWISVYETASGLAAGRREAEARSQRGIASRVLDAAGVRELLPEIGASVVGGVHSPDCHMCSDPAGFVARLAADFEADGGRIERRRVYRLAGGTDGMVLETDAGRDFAEHVVVATGIDSNALARGVGDRFPLETERGYHVMIPDGRARPAMPVMAGEHKFVTTPMDGGLRLAGLTELGGTRLPADPRRYATLLRHGARLFPALRATEYSEWLGFRSTLPDSLPVIGRSAADGRVSYAFGHQHLGLTLAGLTGRLIADDLAGRPPPIDMAPLRPDRWRSARGRGPPSPHGRARGVSASERPCPGPPDAHEVSTR